MLGSMITLVLVDDDDGFRRLARLALSSDGVDVVGEAVDGASAVATIDACDPEVVLLDIGLPDLGGREVATRLRDAGCTATVILISSRPSSFGDAAAAGVADGFIRKDRLSLDSIRAIVGATP